MSATGQPATGAPGAPRRVRPGLRLIEVLFVLLVLAGIGVYIVARRPKYSDDPRLDRAARALVASHGAGARARARRAGAAIPMKALLLGTRSRLDGRHYLEYMALVRGSCWRAEGPESRGHASAKA